MSPVCVYLILLVMWYLNTQYHMLVKFQYICMIQFDKYRSGWIIFLGSITRNTGITWLTNAGEVTLNDRENPLQWRHNERDGISNHQSRDVLLNRLFRRISKKTSKLRVTGHCAGNSPVTVNSPHEWPVTRKMFSFDDVIMGLSVPNHNQSQQQSTNSVHNSTGALTLCVIMFVKF